MLAAAIGVHRAIERHVRRLVVRHDGAAGIERDLGGERRRLVIRIAARPRGRQAPAVVLQRPLAQLVAAGPVADRAAALHRLIGQCRVGDQWQVQIGLGFRHGQILLRQREQIKNKADGPRLRAMSRKSRASKSRAGKGGVLPAGDAGDQLVHDGRAFVEDHAAPGRIGRAHDVFVGVLEVRDVRIIAPFEPDPAVEAIAADDRILVRGSELDHAAGHASIRQLLADGLTTAARDSWASLRT